MKKYKLTDECIIQYSRKLYRIEAIKDFADVRKGYKGGYIEKEENLSQEGNCWVYNKARVYGDAKVQDNASIHNNVVIYDSARVYDDASIYDSATIKNNASIFGNAKIYGNAVISGEASVFGNAEIHNAAIGEGATISEDAQICFIGHIVGNATICGNAIIKSIKDYIVFKNWWSSGRYFTWTRSNNMWSVGCFYGTGKELIEKAYEDSESSGREYKRIVDYVESIIKD